MTTGDEPRPVGPAVAARRGALGMTRQDLADAAGVDMKTVYGLESGRRWPIARNRVAISAALGWKGDALAAIAAGAPPAEAEDGQPQQAAPAPPPGRLPVLDDPDEAGLLPYLRSVWRDLAAAVARHGSRALEDLPGAEIFTDPLESMWWDTVPMAPRNKERLIARTRRFTAEGPDPACGEDRDACLVPGQVTGPDPSPGGT